MFFINHRGWKYFSLLTILTFLCFPTRVLGATVTTFSDTLSDSRPSTAANHTISWDVIDAGGFVADDVFTLTFASDFDTSTIVEDDVDVEDDGVDVTSAADCSGSEKVSIAMAADVLTVTGCTGDGVSIAGIMTVKIGTNTDGSGVGTHQITNPTAGSYTITLASTNYTDTGQVQVAVIAGVTTTATVTASLSASVSAVNTGADLDDAGDEVETADITSTSSTMPFSTLTVNTAKSGAHDVQVSTNAGEGYTTTIRWVNGTGSNDGLISAVTNNCDGFTYNDGGGAATNAAPNLWAGATNPDGVAANTNTCWYGYTTNDSALGTGTTDRFTSPADLVWAPFDSTAYEVAYASAPVNAQTTRIAHRVEANSLQPQGTYTGIIEYIATAVF